MKFFTEFCLQNGLPLEATKFAVSLLLSFPIALLVKVSIPSGATGEASASKTARTARTDNLTTSTALPHLINFSATSLLTIILFSLNSYLFLLFQSILVYFLNYLQVNPIIIFTLTFIWLLAIQITVQIYDGTMVDVSSMAMILIIKQTCFSFAYFDRRGLDGEMALNNEAEMHSSNDRLSNEQLLEKKSIDMHLSDKNSTETLSSRKKSSEQQSTDMHLSDKNSTEKHLIEKKSSEQKSQDKHTTEKHPTQKHPTENTFVKQSKTSTHARLDEYQKKYVIKELPGLIVYLGYMFNVVGFFVGPGLEFGEYFR
jgi:hypothetical protein